MARIDTLIVGETYAYSRSTYGDPRYSTPSEFGEFLGVEHREESYRDSYYRTKYRRVRHARFRKLGTIVNGEALVGVDRTGVRLPEPAPEVIVPPKFVDPRGYGERPPTTPQPFDPDEYNGARAADLEAVKLQESRDRHEARTRLVPALNRTAALLGEGNLPYPLNTLVVDLTSTFRPQNEDDQVAAVTSGQQRDTLRLLAAIYEAQGAVTAYGAPLIAPLQEG